MSCQCKSPFPCSLTELEKRVKELEDETGIPHYVAWTGMDCFELACANSHAIYSCPLDKIYDDWFGKNYHNAETCAEEWNCFSQSNNSPVQYETRRIISRFWFTDVWKVSLK